MQCRKPDQTVNFVLLPDNRPLSIDDIVRIKALIPEAINFDYVEEAKLDVNFENTTPASNVKQKDDIFAMDPEHETKLSTVLFFEFIDGELKPKLNRKRG